ncbi:MAG: hypothetical protein IPP83_06015 [Flavobacteriales bacterium]|nr:hypothetical protein [Flavobacteriales bacterium]
MVFNFPEGDTVVANFQNQSYYQLKREHGFAKLNDPNYRMAERQPDGRDLEARRWLADPSGGQAGELHQAVHRYAGGIACA